MPFPSPPGEASSRFPRGSFASAVLLTLVVIAVLVRGAAQAQRVLHGFETRELALERACGRIAHLDEVLTMSARMCASTGDLAWERRYLDHVEQLDQAIADALALGRSAGGVEGGLQTGAANQRLIAMETEAFDLVRAGRADQAFALLSSERYEADKEVYASGNARLLAALRAAVSDGLERARRAAARDRIVLLLGVPLIAMTWLFVARSIGEHIRRRRAVELRLREHAEELERTNEEVRRAARARSDFLARVSHEIRTPMGGVLGAAELLAGSALDRDQRDLLGIVRSSGALVVAIVDDVLDASKIEAGKLHVTQEPCDAAALVREVCGALRTRADAKRIFLRARVEPDVPARVLADPLRLRQILFNLIGNALKFTSQGGVEVTLEHRAAGDAVELRFTVEDTGVGIAPEALPRIFEGFSQADETITSRFGGTGLGLTICRELVQLMGGSIGVESVPGAGTEFRVALTAPAAPSSPEAEVDIPVEVRFEGARVLVAEDNPVNQVVARRMLEALGCDVVIASDGAACIELASRERFAMIFLDCRMPGVDGFEAARTLRARETGTRQPIVALTASALPEDVEACRAAGMDDVVAKPFTAQELRAVLVRFLGRELAAAV